MSSHYLGVMVTVHGRRMVVGCAEGTGASGVWIMVLGLALKRSRDEGSYAL